MPYWMAAIITLSSYLSFQTEVATAYLHIRHRVLKETELGIDLSLQDWSTRHNEQQIVDNYHPTSLKEHTCTHRWQKQDECIFCKCTWIIGFYDIIKWLPFRYMSINFWKDAYRFACVLELLIPLKATKLYSKLAHDYKVYLPLSSSIQGCVLYNEANHSTQCCRCSKIKYKKFASADYKVFTIIHRVSLMCHSLLCCGSLEASWRAWACSSGKMSLRQCVCMSVHALFSSYHSIHITKNACQNCSLRWFAYFNHLPTGQCGSTSNGWSNINAPIEPNCTSPLSTGLRLLQNGLGD